MDTLILFNLTIKISRISMFKFNQNFQLLVDSIYQKKRCSNMIIYFNLLNKIFFYF